MNEDSACFPKIVKLWPLVGLKSIHLPEASGAWRWFVLAKNLAGIFDHVERERVKAFANYLGISNRKYNRWLTAARKYNLVQDVQRDTGEWSLILTGKVNAAHEMESKDWGMAVTLPVELLVGEDWRGYVFASWQSAFTNNGERLVSQKKQAEITGISEQTQRKFNKEAGVQSQKNYAISNIHANGYSSVLEFGNRAGLFEYWNKETHQKYLGWRIPNSRYFPLFGVGGSYKMRRTMSLFNRTAEQLKASEKAIRKLGYKFPEIYILDRTSRNGNVLWIHLPLLSKE